MKRVIYIFFIGILSVSLAGCVTAKKVVRERVDQELSGNQGYLKGVADSPKAEGPKNREYIDITVELPMWDEVKQNLAKRKTEKRTRTEDKGSSGNKGYIMSSRGFEEELPVVYEIKPQTAAPKKAEPAKYYKEEAAVESIGETQAVTHGYKEYTVKKGDTLSHIAKAFYNKASKWTVIYEANSDKIKDPASLKPGTVLIIPDIETVESEYIK